LRRRTNACLRRIAEQEFRGAREQSERLVLGAADEIDRLFPAVGRAGCCLLLTDRDGIALEWRGTALADERPVAIIRDQHFFVQYDYAFEVFDLIEMQHPGIGAALRGWARKLFGGRNSPPTPPGKSGGYLITDGEADLMMSYYSNARLLAADPAFAIVEIPAEFVPKVEYGLGVPAQAADEAWRLRDFMLSDRGQEILESAGFVRIG